MSKMIPLPFQRAYIYIYNWKPKKKNNKKKWRSTVSTITDSIMPHFSGILCNSFVRETETSIPLIKSVIAWARFIYSQVIR